MPLVRSDIHFDKDAALRVLVDGGLEADIDAYTLFNQPAEWMGMPHPLAGVPHQPSPSFLHETDLPSAGNEVLTRLNADTRKRIMRRMRKMEELGPVSLVHASTPEQVSAIVESYRRYKPIRFEEMGALAEVDVASTSELIAKTALGPSPAMEVYGLLAGDRIASMCAGVPHAGRFHAMVNSYDTSTDLARTSPGELITLQLMQWLADRGFREFDLGVGEAPYKDKWCERKRPLFDAFVSVNPKGGLYCVAQRGRQRVKRMIKQNHALWSMVMKARSLARRRS
jgi:CelD/BcsL family acetyltransferase involved in cellulose biosynthesis